MGERLLQPLERPVEPYPVQPLERPVEVEDLAAMAAQRRQLPPAAAERTAA